MNNHRTYAESCELAELAIDFPAAVDDATAIDAPRVAGMLLDAMLEMSRMAEDVLADTRIDPDARHAWLMIRESQRMVARALADVVLASRLTRSVQ